MDDEEAFSQQDIARLQHLESAGRVLYLRMEERVDEFIAQMKRHGSPGITRISWWRKKGWWCAHSLYSQVLVTNNGSWQYLYMGVDDRKLVLGRRGGVFKESYIHLSSNVRLCDIQHEEHFESLVAGLGYILLSNNVPFPGTDH